MQYLTNIHNSLRIITQLKQWTEHNTQQQEVLKVNKKLKKAELSQRWPRDAPYVWVPWKFSGVPDYAHGYFSQNF